MNTIAVGELKTHFSEVLADVRKGRSFTIAFGRRHKPVAMIVPYKEENATGIRLGALAGCVCEMGDDFGITDDELVAL